MAEPPGLATVTSTALLEGLRDPGNRTVWTAYVLRYRPLIVGYAVGVGVPAADAEDIAQAALLAFSESYRSGKYDRERGRLSSWLFGIVHRHVLKHRERTRREVVAAGGTRPTAELPAEDQLEPLWEREWQDQVLKACFDRVRGEVTPATMRAFEEFALRGRPAVDVARDLGLTRNAVFGAKRRVLDRVRELLPQVTESW